MENILFLADTPLQQISHSAQLDTCSQPSEDMPRTALSGQNVAHNLETAENEAMSTEETEVLLIIWYCFVLCICLILMYIRVCILQ